MGGNHELPPLKFPNLFQYLLIPRLSLNKVEVFQYEAGIIWIFFFVQANPSLFHVLSGCKEFRGDHIFLGVKGRGINRR